MNEAKYKNKMFLKSLGALHMHYLGVFGSTFKSIFECKWGVGKCILKRILYQSITLLKIFSKRWHGSEKYFRKANSRLP